MRQVGSLTNHDDAQRFLAYLVTQRIDAQAEQEGERWVIWVHEEDRVPLAKSALSEFQADPTAPKYQDAKRRAETVLREEQTKRRQAQKNVVEMRSRWGSGGVSARKAPLMISLAGLAVLVSMLTGSLFIEQQRETPRDSAALAALLFADPRPTLSTPTTPEEGKLPPASPFISISRGQLWRIITPIFLHFSIMHLVFNLYWFWSFGGQIEDLRGATRFALLVLIIGALSNIGQAVVTGPNFGGLSGVVYGLLGYLWMRVRQGNAEGYQLSTSALVISLVFFVLCIARQEPNLGQYLTAIPDNVANVAHGVGLVVGIALGLMPDSFGPTKK
jgi:GlpG protein